MRRRSRSRRILKGVGLACTILTALTALASTWWPVSCRTSSTPLGLFTTDVANARFSIWHAPDTSYRPASWLWAVGTDDSAFGWADTIDAAHGSLTKRELGIVRLNSRLSDSYARLPLWKPGVVLAMLTTLLWYRDRRRGIASPAATI